MVALTDALLARTGAGLVLVTHAPDEATALQAQAWQLSGQPAQLQKD
jgi:NitT/TauT family transport system ATP-binding protein